MKTNKTLILVTTAFLILMLTSCFPNSATADSSSPSGFFMGIWHGWIAPVSLIIGFFNHSVRIYDPVNTGWTYDLGFYIAVISGFGGISLFRHKRKDK